jgi:GAF domain-containing protein/ActR/RegA family two-component response regulator
MPDLTLRVLIVEDDEGEREELAEWLRRKEQITAETAASGKEALEKVRAVDGNYDAVLMDQVLPDMEGIEVMRRLRQDFPAVQVIMMTGKEPEAGVEALRQGAYRYIIKPVNNEEIAILLRSVAEIRRLARLGLLKALHQTSLDIVRELDPAKLMPTIIERAARLVAGEHEAGIGAAYWECDHSRRVATIKYSPNPRLVGQSCTFDEGLVGEVIRTGKARYVNDYPRWERRLSLFVSGELAGLIRNVVEVPIKEGEKVVAVLAVSDSSGDRRFGDSDIEVLERFASLVAIATRNAELYQQALRRQRVLEKLGQLGQEMGNLAWHGLQRRLEQVARRVCERVGADCAVIYPYDPAREGYFDSYNVASHGFWYPLVLTDKPRTHGMTVRVKSSDGWLQVSDVSQARELLPPSSLLDREGICAFVGLLLRDDDGAERGVMYVNFRQPHSISDRERRLIEEQAREAVQAIRERGQVRGIQLPALLQRIVQDAQQSLAADIVTLYQYRRGRDVEFVTPPVVAGEVRVPVPMGRKIYENDLPALLVKEGKSYYADDVTTDPFLATVSPEVEPRDGQPARPRFIQREDIRSSAGVLLRAEDEIVGVMFVNYRTPRSFDEELKQEIDLFAGQAAAAIRNARLFEQTQALVEIGQAIAEAALDPERLLDLVLERTLELVGFSKGWISLLEPGTDRLKIQVARGLGREQWRELEKGRGITGHVAQTGILMNVPNVKEEPLYEEFFPDTRSELCAPLKYRDEVLGVLNLESARPDAFSSRDEELVSALAGHAAVAVRNARSYERTRRQAEALQRIVGAIGDPHALPSILKEAVDLVRAEYGSFSLVDREAGKRTYQAIWEKDRMLAGEQIPAERRVRDWDRGIVGRVARTGEPHRSGDVERDGDYEKWYDSTRSELAVPLKDAGGRTIGVLNLESPLSNAFSQEDEDFCQNLARVAAAVVEKAASYEQRRKDIAALQEINDAVTSGKQDEILQLVVQQAVEVLGGEYASLWLLDPGSGDLVFEAAHGPGKEAAERRERIKAGTPSINMRVAQSGKPYLCPDVSLEGVDFLRLYEDARSSVTVPLKYRGRVIGTLNVESSRLDAFGEEHSKLLMSFADQAAVAIENARLYELEKQRSETLDLLQKVSARVSSTLDLNQVMELIVRGAMRLTGATSGVVHLLDREGRSVVRSFEYPEGFEHPTPRLGQKESMTQTIIDTGQMIAVPDITKEKKVSPVMMAKGVRSLVGVPLKYQARVIGVLYLNAEQSRDFAQDELLLCTLADQAAVAIENARLYERLDRKARNLQALYHMGQRLTSGVQLSTEEIVALIEEQASQLMDTQNMYIALYDAATDTVSFPFMRVGGQPRQVAARRGGQGRTEWIVRNKRPMLITTRAESEAWYKEPGRKEYIQEPFSSWVGAPMIVGDEVLGVIAAYHEEKEHVYDEDDLEIVSLMASQAAIALKNARQIEIMRDLAVNLSTGAV